MKLTKAQPWPTLLSSSTAQKTLSSVIKSLMQFSSLFSTLCNAFLISYLFSEEVSIDHIPETEQNIVPVITPTANTVDNGINTTDKTVVEGKSGYVLLTP